MWSWVKPRWFLPKLQTIGARGLVGGNVSDQDIRESSAELVERAYELAQDHWSAQCFDYTFAPESMKREAQQTARDGFNEIALLLGKAIRLEK